MKVRFHAIGQWRQPDLLVRQVADQRPRIHEIEKIIEDAWQAAMNRTGLNLFDGPMSRLERFSAGKILELELSATSYRIFWGTNLHNAGLAEKYGQAALANGVGLSCALESADGFLLLGRRNATVAYYPSRIHPFAGSLETGPNVDPFAEIRRELFEELGLGQRDITNLTCLGIIEDASIRQPELIFSATARRTRSEIKESLNASEHKSLVAIDPADAPVRFALADPQMTPVALGTTLLWGREHFGDHWFDSARRAVNLGES